MNPFSSDIGGTATYDVELLNALLRDELSAVETYNEALHRIGNHWGSKTLNDIRSDHREAADWLCDRVSHAGGHPVDSPGLWGAFASLMGDAAGLMGMATVIAALKQGEQVGINEYEEVLRNDEVDAECREYLLNRMIPDGYRHLLELDHMLAQDNRA